MVFSKTKRRLAILLTLTMTLSACATTQEAVSQPEATPEAAPVETAGIYTPGTYTASAKGFGGSVTAAVETDKEKIISVKLEGTGETEGIGSNAIEQLPDLIVSANGTAVDAISGATTSSNAVFEAVEAALAEARGEKPAEAALAFNAGTYTGKGMGYVGDLLLDVTFSDNAITGIEVKESKETEHVGTSAFDIMFNDIMEFTSTGVDVVSGATFSSNAVITAVEDAAVQAGCEVSAIRKGAKVFAYSPGAKITDTYDVVVVGAGGAGMSAAAAAAQNGASVIVLEKMAEMGGNTLVAGGSYQSVEDSLVWDSKNPDATEATAPNGDTVEKNKMDAGRLVTLNTILNWKETPFDGTITDPTAIKNVDDYNLPERGVHAEYLPTLQTLKAQIKDYMTYANAKMQAGAKETDLTLFSTVELHIFQTYYGGLRLNAEKNNWIVNDFELVSQLCSNASDIKPWLAEQGSQFNYTAAGTLIGCLWQRINRQTGATIDGVEHKDKWGAYFKAPENTMLKANPKNQIMTRTTVTELISDGNRVTGVKGVQYDGTEVEITATKGVILATGGYAANIPMVLETNEYWSPEYLTPAIKTTNRSLAQGEGITMAQAVGADVVGMGWTQLMPLSWVDNGNLSYGTGETVIYISPAGTPNAGKRYVDESAERDVLSQAAYDYGAELGQYIELGNAATGTHGVHGVEGGTVNTPSKTSADNVEGRVYYCNLTEASELLGIDAAVLEKTITEYDAYVIGASTTAPVPAKSAYRGTIGSCEMDENGTYLPDTYKLDLFMVRYMAPSTHHTMGGLKVDLERHVLDVNGNVIPGLYAAGEVTGGVFAGNRLGGNAITEIIVSGRIAAEAVVNGK